jgi:hypothetical protein
MSFHRTFLALALAIALPLVPAHADPFTFQGFLEQSGTPLNGNANLAFKLYDAQSGGSQLGSTITANPYPVLDGVFTIDLNFAGVAFAESNRWLQVEVGGTPLGPRIEMLATPLAASTRALQGRGVSAAAPASGQVLKWNGSAWAPAADNGGSSYSAGSGLTLSGTTFSVSFAGSGAANSASRSDHDHVGAEWIGSSAGEILEISNTSGLGSSVAVRGNVNGGIGVLGFAQNPGAIGVQGSITGASGVGVSGTASSANAIGVAGSGSGTAVSGVSSGSTGIGVKALAESTSGMTAGLAAEARSPDGAAVFAVNNAASGNAIGVYATTSSSTGSAILAEGHTAVDAQGQIRGVLAHTTSANGVAVFAEADGTDATTGVYGASSASNGTGVFGRNLADTGAAAGVYGTTNSDDGFGVWGQVGGSGTGSPIGVHGESAASSGYGVFATNSAVSGNAYGAYAQTNSTAGTALVGDAIATSGSNRGVLARTASGGGVGVRAENNATSGAGSGNALVAVGNLPSGDTMVVEANGTSNAWAIRARSAGTSALNASLTTVGVNGSTISATVNSASGRAGYFANSAAGGQAAQFIGDVSVSGTLSKGGGSFKIDHPLDPANKFLLHSFVESPDMMNIYNGNVITDASGRAIVELPVWFEVLNRDFRYQLTTIGSFARAMVAEEVAGNRFAIRTDEPNTKVSWQLTGIRKDAWAEANRIPVELDKTGAERGTYLHPDVYGQPADKRIGIGAGSKE